MHRAHCGPQCVAALRTACLALGWEAACAGLEAAWKEELSKGLSGAFLRDAVHDPLLRGSDAKGGPGGDSAMGCH